MHIKETFEWKYDENRQKKKRFLEDFDTKHCQVVFSKFSHPMISRLFFRCSQDIGGVFCHNLHNTRLPKRFSYLQPTRVQPKPLA